MKKFLSTILTLCICLILSSTAFANQENTAYEYDDDLVVMSNVISEEYDIYKYIKCIDSTLITLKHDNEKVKIIEVNLGVGNEGETGEEVEVETYGTLKYDNDYIMPGSFIHLDIPGIYTLVISGYYEEEAFFRLYRITVESKLSNLFSDVDSTAYYADAVKWAVENNVTNGTGNNQFSPKATCTRGQVVTFLWRANGCPEPTTKENIFDDVKETDYFYKAVLWAVENNITKGTGDNTFSPDSTCTHGQVITFIYRVNGSQTMSRNKYMIGKYGDTWYTDAISWANLYSIIDVVAGFEPNIDCPRADIVYYLYQADKYKTYINTISTLGEDAFWDSLMEPEDDSNKTNGND